MIDWKSLTLGATLATVTVLALGAAVQETPRYEMSQIPSTQGFALYVLDTESGTLWRVYNQTLTPGWHYLGKPWEDLADEAEKLMSEPQR